MESEIEKAIKVLKNGGLIVYPTETVYGIGADIFNQEAVNRIYELKGRETTKSLSIAIEKTEIGTYAEVNESVQELIENYLPGPLTLILKKKEKVPDWISPNPYVGIRVPENKTVQRIIQEFGPITSTSANLSGQKEPTNCEDISKQIKNGVDYVLDEGETKYKGPSTVVKVNDKVEILRKGVLDLWTQK